MKKIIPSLLLICCIVSFVSCSLTFEKRRYRPGYHIDVVQKQHMHCYPLKDVEVSVKSNDIKPQKTQIDSHKIKNLKDDDSQIEKQNPTSLINTKSIKSPSKVSKKIKFLDLKKIKDATEAKGKKGKIIAAWILGAASMGFAAGAFASLTIGFGFGGIFFAILISIAVILAVLALIIRFTTPAEEKEKVRKERVEKHKTVDAKFIETSFIYCIITASFALIGLILAVIVLPVGIIGGIISIIALPASIVSIALGFRSRIDDKGPKPKWIIILAFLALLLAIIATVLFFI